MKINGLIAVLFLASCSNIPYLSSSKPLTEIVEKKTQSIGRTFNGEQIAETVEANTCEGCLIGSASQEILEGSTNKVYFLYGAEHLNLKNYYYDIPVVYNKAVKKWITYFTGKGRHHFERYSKRAGTYAPILTKILREKEMPQDLMYLSMAESGFQTNAKSWAKAVGAWQFMPYTGKKYGLKIDWYIDQRRDPFKATEAAANYLSYLNDMFGSWELAMAAYNAGEGKIGRAIRRYKTKNFWKIRRGRYLKSETKNYVPKIMALAIIGKNLESFGFDRIDYHAPLDFDVVEVAANSDLYYIADALNVDFDQLKDLNPELRRWQTPAGNEKYFLKIPKGSSEAWAECCQANQFIANNNQMYELKGRSRLKDVARKFKLPVNLLRELNPSLHPKHKLHPKTAVVLPFRNGQSRRHKMYSDLYELPPRRLRRRRAYRRRIARAVRRGKLISTPSEYYTVKKGDTLWEVSRKTGVSLDTLIRSNLRLIKRRQIMPGDKLAIR
jgi:membrane-bound lytic murein transglycosylase D